MFLAESEYHVEVVAVVALSREIRRPLRIAQTSSVRTKRTCAGTANAHAESLRVCSSAASVTQRFSLDRSINQTPSSRP